MELLIPEISLPKKGERKLILIDDNGQISIWDGHYSFVTLTRAKEIKSHGRLGDLDAMKNDFTETVKQCILYDNGKNDDTYLTIKKIMNGVIDMTPTVIEASDEYK